VTSRLADSVPQQLEQQWGVERDTWLEHHGVATPNDLPPTLRLEYHAKFNETFQSLLDAGHGGCCLVDAEIADILVEKFLEGHATCFNLHSLCIMPNHFHVVIEPNQGSSLGEIIQHWKGGSAFLINCKLGRSGKLWQAEPFDHIVRSQTYWRHYNRYVAENPAKAGLREGFVLGFGAERGLRESEMLQRIECAYEAMLQ
jgi:putative transposase